LWRRVENNLPLQVDASICYAQKKSFENCDLTPEAFKFDSPYNTYLYYGLPPTPISNPGLESLKAAYSPLANDYWYYLTNRKTKETFSQKLMKSINKPAKNTSKLKICIVLGTRPEIIKNVSF